MPIEREATLKKAEKLLRQGKLDGAIAEYVRLIEEHPRDWNSINALGDLYVRAGQPDNAAAQFTRVADHLHAEGFMPKAAALYKKVLKIKTDDEHALLQLADIAARQGALVEGKTYFRQIADRRRARGDQRGAAELVVRLGEIDPDDAEAKVQAARAAQSLGNTARACDLLAQAANAYERQRHMPDALAALAEAVGLDPSNAPLRTRLLSGLIGQGEIVRAKAIARTSAELLTIAGVLEQQGKRAEALDILVEAAQLDPSNLALRGRLAKECVAAGSLQQARQFLNAQTAGDDPDLLMTLARLELQSGRINEAKTALNRLLALRPDRRSDLVSIVCELGDRKLVDAAFACAELVADSALLEEDWTGAAAAVNEFVARVPNHIPALMKLVEICVDGGLESTMYAAQAQLADAYLAGGLGAEARVIAEDLVAREPWVRANIDRFRRALVLLGVADPDAVIAERLSGETPFVSLESGAESREALASTTSELPPVSVSVEVAELPELPPLEPDSPPLEPELPPLEPDLPPPLPPAATPAARPPAEDPDAITLDLSEIDLSDALSGLDALTPAPVKPVEAAPARPAPPIEEVFGELRSKAVRESQLENAQAHYAAAIDHANHGRLDQAIQAFEEAARVPLMRFQAGTRLGRLHVARGDLAPGVEWLERAAEAPAPSAEEGHAVMYELADALERLGESARALAVLLELHADAGSYRDVATRIDRLSKVQTGR